MSDKKSRKKEFVENLKIQIKKEIKNFGISHVSKILEKYRAIYLNKITQFNIKDPEQSWKPFKGKILEEIIMDYIKLSLKENGFEIVRGSVLEREDHKLNECLAKVKRSLVVDYGKFGMHLPDADLVIYEPKECRAVAIISSKVTLRERIAQTGYWSLKLKSSPITDKIQVFFVTLDEDKDLTRKDPSKKGRAIAEVDLDGTYVVINKEEIEESDKVKTIEKIIYDLKKLSR